MKEKIIELRGIKRICRKVLTASGEVEMTRVKALEPEITGCVMAPMLPARIVISTKEVRRNLRTEQVSS